MNDMSAKLQPDMEAVTLVRGALPDAPMPMPAQRIELPRRTWFAGLTGARQQPDRA